MNQILQGDAVAVLRTLPENSVQCCVTSPPYWGLRDYGVEGQLGLEKTPEEYVAKMVEVFREVRRVLRGDGTCFLNIGDSYAGSWGNYGGQNRGKGTQRTITTGSQAPNPAYDGLEQFIPPGASVAGLKPKDLVGIPWRLAFALQADGWWLRQDIIWHKPNPMPESVTDRCTKAHEYIFLLTKSARYFFDAEAIKEQCSDSTHARISQNLQAQVGSFRANGGGKTNGPMKAVIAGSTRKMAEAGSGTKNNTSFEGACVMPVTDRNKRSVWTVPSAPYSEAHFATFPPDLIKPCILAGTSARGCCPKCGAPWERVTEDAPDYAAFKANEKERKGGGMRSSSLETSGLTRGTSNKSISAQSQTTGWKPTCTCNAKEIITQKDTIPCTVLDPFFGSGTTGMVSLELGRKCIGIELNPKYIELAEHRCHVTPGLALA